MVDNMMITLVKIVACVILVDDFSMIPTNIPIVASKINKPKLFINILLFTNKKMEKHEMTKYNMIHNK